MTIHSALAFRYDILSAYTGCNLTYSSGRLVTQALRSYLRKRLVTNMQRDSGIVSLGVIHMDPIG